MVSELYVEPLPCLRRVPRNLNNASWLVVCNGWFVYAWFSGVLGASPLADCAKYGI